jgi:heme/copper-type cytochrome/quinol oxidase subunit 2
MKRILPSLLALAAVLVIAGVATACPGCKDQLAADPAAHNLARGYFWSILFMLTMPILIFTGLGSYFYWEVRRAYAREALEAAAEAQAQPVTDA